MISANSIREFVAAPVGRFIAGTTYLIWCRAPDLIGSLQWGVPSERDLGELIDILELVHHPDLAPVGCVLMDCREIERIDASILLDFAAYAVKRVPMWSSRIHRHAVLVPQGLLGILLAGVLPSLAASHPVYCGPQLDGAVGFLGHPGAAAAHAEAMALSAETRGTASVIVRLRAQLKHCLTTASVEASATQLGLSTRTLQRRLRDLQTSFSNELRHTRLATAVDLLRSTDDTVEDIALQVGYENGGRMSAALRESYGFTARELRRDRVGAFANPR